MSGFTLAEKMAIVVILGIVASLAMPSVVRMLNQAKLKQTVAEVQTALNETQREAIRGNKICTVTLNFVEGEVKGSCLKTGNRTLASEVAVATNLTDNRSGSSPSSQQPGQFDTAAHLPSDPEPSSRVTFLSNHQDRHPAKATVVVKIIAVCKTVPSRLDRGNCKPHDISWMRKGAVWVAASPLSSPSITLLPSPPSSPSGTPSPSPSPKSAPSQMPSSFDIPIQYGVLGNPVFSIESGGKTPTDPTGKIVFFFPDDQQTPKHCIAISNTLGLTRVGTYIGETTPVAITHSGRCTAEGWNQQ